MFKHFTGWLLGGLTLLSWTSPALAADHHLLAGPMVGDTSSHSSQIWVQTAQAARIQIAYWPAEQSPQAQKKSSVVVTNPERFFTGLIPLQGLQAGQRYNYQVYINDQLIERPYALSFSTAPNYHPDQQNPPEVKALLGSCYFLNDEIMNLANIKYGSGFEIFASMARQNDASMMLWLGDNVYFAPFDLSNLYNMNRRYAKHRQASEIQPLLGMMPHYAIWDDHDFGPNNADKNFWRRNESLQLFKAYWANPRYGLLSTPGVFFQKSWSDVDFFLTDNRFYRDPNNFPDPQKRSFLGREQLNWLKTALKGSQATFKTVVIGSPVFNQNYVESFSLATGEYNELLDFLEAEKIEGVVFISGDRHHTDLTKKERPGAYPLYNYTNSPLTSEPTRILSAQEAQDPMRVPGSLFRERNFGRIHVSGPKGSRVMNLETYNVQGQKVWTYQIKAADLSYR